MLFILYRVRHVVCIIKETLISCLIGKMSTFIMIQTFLPSQNSLFSPSLSCLPALLFQPSHPSHPSPLPIPMYTKRLSNIYKCEGFFQANVNVLFTTISYIFPLRREWNLSRSCWAVKRPALTVRPSLMASPLLFFACKISALFALFRRWAVAPWMVVVSLFENISLLGAADDVDGVGTDEVDSMVRVLSLSIISSRYLPTFTFCFSF